MSQFDGSTIQGSSGGELSQQQQQQDSSFENDLMMLMGNLDQVSMRWAQVTGPKRVPATFETARIVLSQLFEFSEARMKADFLEEPSQRARSLYQTAADFEKKLARVSQKVLVGIREEKGHPESASLRLLYRQYGEELLDGLKLYFTLFARCFNSPAKTAQWKETFQVFLDGLKRNW